MSNEKPESKAIEPKGHDIVVVPRTDAQPPEKLTGLRTSKPKQNSVGLPGIFASITHATKYMRPSEAMRTMFRMNQQGGFDCPGCAWPDPDDERSALGEYCENGIKAIAEEAQNKRIGRDFFAAHSVEEMATWSDFEIGKKGRLAEPMVLWEGETHYQPITWQEAFDLMGQELQGLESPDEAVFYTSGRTSNEAAFLYQLMVREYGTNNLPDCSNMCHESSGTGLAETVGIGKGSVTLTDLYEADVVMVIGQNPGTNHPRMLSALEKCKENGGKIITVNPLPEAGLLRFTNPQRPLKMVSGGTKLTDLFLPVRINEDVALLKAIMKLLLEFEQESPGSVIDQTFIDEYTEGYETLVADLKAHSLGDLMAKTGLEETAIREAAAMLRNTNKIIICWAMGIT
ncbi:MAG: molybdopterin-dependent oxidoreductase, partial [Bacteroidota bacterium]